MSNSLPAFWGFIRGLPHFLKEPISYETGRTIILHRLEQRNGNFLQMVKRCVYQNPRSPYLPLLREARCEYGDMESFLARNELESLLTQLLDAGVCISLEEYKGRKPLVRNGASFLFEEEDFDNPLLTQGWEARTGGSTGRPSRMLVDLEFLADRAPYEQVMFHLLALHEVPLALWYPKVPVSIGLSNSLRYAKVGKPPEAWFDMKLGINTVPFWHLWALSAIIGVSRLSAVPIPWPQAAPLDDPGVILAWILNNIQHHGRCAVQSNVSGVVRLCHAAVSRGIDLRGVQFITGSEPLTPSKHMEIVASQARAFLRYNTVDIGSIASGCGAPADIDEVHLLSDTVALVSPDAEPRLDGSRRLSFTYIPGKGPKVVINVDLGDQAIIKERRCGCPFEELGFHTHLSHVRSASRSTMEGIALQHTDLVRISEEILPRIIGGSILDYQWVEDEDPKAGSLTRLWLRVAPRLGTIDESGLRRDILAEIGKMGAAQRFYAQLMDDAKTLRILREDPRPTPAGKVPAVVRGRRSGMPAS